MNQEPPSHRAAPGHAGSAYPHRRGATARVALARLRGTV